MFSAKKFLSDYFTDLFVNRDLSTIDKYLDKNHFDYDIGPSVKYHIENSKQYLLELFKRRPTIRVKVLKVKTIDNVACAQLRWYETIEKKEKIWLEGVATFLIIDKKIVKRNTLIYKENI
jgi:hypothetical protein